MELCLNITLHHAHCILHNTELAPFLLCVSLFWWTCVLFLVRGAPHMAKCRRLQPHLSRSKERCCLLLVRGQDTTVIQRVMRMLGDQDGYPHLLAELLGEISQQCQDLGFPPVDVGRDLLESLRFAWVGGCHHELHAPHRRRGAVKERRKHAKTEIYKVVRNTSWLSRFIIAGTCITIIAQRIHMDNGITGSSFPARLENMSFGHFRTMHHHP